MSQRNAFADWLIRRAARGAPQPLSERLVEEWQSDMLARSSDLSRLRFALGCCWAAMWIAREYARAAMPAAATAGTGTVAVLHEEPGLFTGRSVSFFLVVLLHAALFYALVISLGSTFTKAASPPPFVTRMIDRPRTPEPIAPTTVPSSLPWTNIRVPIPDVRLPADPTSDETVRGEITTRVEPPTTILPPRAHELSRVPGGPGVGFPNPDDFYPSVPRGLGQEGNVIVQVCVDTKGRLTNEPTALQSSGNGRLDAGALALARAGSGHYRATTEDGRPVDACYPYRVVFKLRK